MDGGVAQCIEHICHSDQSGVRMDLIAMQSQVSTSVQTLMVLQGDDGGGVHSSGCANQDLRPKSGMASDDRPVLGS